MNDAESRKDATTIPSDPAAQPSWPLGVTRLSIAAFALLAALGSFGIGEATHRWFQPALVLQSVIGSTKAALPTLETEFAATTRNAALAFGALGACLAGALGVAGGLSRKSPQAAAIGGLSGLILGGILGAGASLTLIPPLLQARYRHSEYESFVAFVIHGAPWGLIGGAAGAALALGRKDSTSLGRTALAGVVGALIGSIAFDLLGGLFFVTAEIENPISETRISRFLARFLVCLGVAAAVALSLNPRERKRSAVDQPPATS